MGLKFTVTGGPNTSEMQKLMRSWKGRSRALRRFVAFSMAKQAYESLQDKIPKGEAWNAYRTSLQIAEVPGLKNADSFLIRANPRSRTVSDIDAPITLLYIRSRPRLRRIPPKVKILEKYNPWTLQTLPFTPSRMDAVVVSRKVTKREHDQVQRARIKDQMRWRKDLTGVGVRVPVVRPDKQKSAKTIPDVAHEAFRLEFGIGVKSEAHWRPSVQHVMRQGIRDLKRDRRITASMIKPSFTLWRSWGKIKARTKVRASEARDFVPFQRKLGIRVSK